MRRSLALLLSLGLAASACTSTVEDDTEGSEGAYTGGKSTYDASGVGYFTLRRKSTDRILEGCTATLVNSTTIAVAKSCADAPDGHQVQCERLPACCASLREAANDLRQLTYDKAEALSMCESASFTHMGCTTVAETYCDGTAPATENLVTMDVFFGANPTRPQAGEKWIHVREKAAEAGPFLLLTLADPAPIEPLPIQVEPLDPSARWATVRIVGYGQTSAWAAFRNSTPGERNDLELRVHAVTRDTIEVRSWSDKGMSILDDADKGGPMIMNLDGKDTVVGVQTHDTMNGVRLNQTLLFARTDAQPDLFRKFLPAQ